MKRPAHLRTVEWHESASDAERAPTLEDVERDASSFDDERGSGVHARTVDSSIEGLEAEQAEAGEVSDENEAELEGSERVDQVGPYRLIERIGSGAMGHVYRAEHTLLGRAVAIKMLRPELVGDEACVRRFLAEARAVNLIAHEHIIDVTDFACTPGGQPWFVMELLEGSDLAAAASKAKLTIARALEVTHQLCEALCSVHAAGIVHRDVKPDNVFLAKRGDQDYVTLLDFGIARLPDPTSADPLQEGLMGTPYYMAPEQISASEIDHRADLYAVGSVLFELLAGMGNTPFRSATLQRQLMDVLMEPAPKLSSRAELPECVREDLDTLVARCLEKQPSDRPSSAREIADELKRIRAKLQPAVAPVAEVQAPSETATLILRGQDANSTAPIEVVETRKRARRELRARRVWSSRGATILSAAAAAAAMWVATSETTWAHALSRVASWGDGEVVAASEPVNVVQPAAMIEDHASPVVEPDLSNETVENTGGVAADAPIFVGTTHPAVPDAPRAEAAAADVAMASAEELASDDEQLDASDRSESRSERRARHEARAKARAEREQANEPSFVIKPAGEPEPAERPTYDRDLVLNPFDE